MTVKMASGVVGTFSVDGNSASLQLSERGLPVKAIVQIYFGAGVTFGSGTITLQVSPDGGTTWVSSGTTVTSATAGDWKVAATVYGTHVRLALTGSTTPTINYGFKAEVERFLTTFFKGTNVAASETSAVLPVRHAGDMMLVAAGTWNSGTVKVQESPDGGTTYYDIATDLTADGVKSLSAGTEDNVRVVITKSGTLDVNVWLFG